MHPEISSVASWLVVKSGHESQLPAESDADCIENVSTGHDEHCPTPE
jgi:hypothetical protein